MTRPLSLGAFTKRHSGALSYGVTHMKTLTYIRDHSRDEPGKDPAFALDTSKDGAPDLMAYDYRADDIETPTVKDRKGGRGLRILVLPIDVPDTDHVARFKLRRSVYIPGAASLESITFGVTVEGVTVAKSTGSDATPESDAGASDPMGAVEHILAKGPAFKPMAVAYLRSQLEMTKKDAEAVVKALLAESE